MDLHCPFYRTLEESHYRQPLILLLTHILHYERHMSHILIGGLPIRLTQNELEVLHWDTHVWSVVNRYRNWLLQLRHLVTDSQV